MRKTLVLDAMGVIYEAADDVAELLVPFISAHGGTTDAPAVEGIYRRASLGQITAEELWRLAGVDASLEDEYLLMHRLFIGLLEFLPSALDRFDRILCLSNDVSEWSVKLRKRLGLERFISGWFVSGDLGVRKPSPEIYERMLTLTGLRPEDIVFVDDRPGNVTAAQALGITGVLWDANGDCSSEGFPIARSFPDILDCA